MKNYSIKTFIIGSLLTIGGLKAQVPTLVKIEDATLKRMINNIRSFNQYQGKDLTITVFEVANQTGSARRAETEEVTSDIYFGISEIDLIPKNSVFCIKNIYSFSDIKMENAIAGEVLISFHYIDIGSKMPIKKMQKIKLSLNKAIAVR